MGLDSVEIVIGVEEFFGIAIPNSVAAKIENPGQLVDFIATTLETAPTGACETQRTFYRMRRGFKRQVAALAPHVDLDTPLKDLVHKDQWPRVWAAIRADVGNEEWPREIAWHTWLGDGPSTIRQLIWRVVEQLPRSVADDKRWTRGEIEAQVRRIIRKVSGKEDFTLRAHFGKEIGLD